MKRSLIYKLLLIPVLFLIGYMNVFAEEGILLCEYNGTRDSKENVVRIYYNPEYNEWEVKYINYWWDYETFKGDKGRGSFEHVFAEKHDIWVNKKNETYSSSQVSTFKCPNKAFTNFYGNAELCFTNEEMCKKDNNDWTGTDELLLNKNIDTPYVYIDGISSKEIFDGMKSQIGGYKEYIYYDVTQGAQKVLIEKFQNKFETDTLPSFVSNYILDKLKNSSDEMESLYSDLTDKYIREAENDPNATDADKEALKKKKNSSFTSEITIAGSNNGEKPSTNYDDFSHNCADTAKVIRIAGYLIFLVKILVPLIIIVKASMDLASTITKGTPEALKKAATKIGISLVSGILIFYIPTILDTIFDLVTKYNGHDEGDFAICEACVFEPFSDTCTSAANDPTNNPYERRKNN